MLTCPPTLYIRRPSPTTIEYTVSTRPPLALPLRILLILTHIIRVVLALGILLLLYTYYLTLLPPPSILSSLTIPPSILLRLQALTTLLSPLLLVPISLALLLFLTLRPHTSESLLILRHLGLQISSSPKTYLSTTKTRFIPSQKIQDIYINEVFSNFEVRYVLVVVVEGEGELVVVFERLLPGRAVLERVWRGGRRGLFGGEERGGGNGDANGGVNGGVGGKESLS
ncbi:putative phosphatidylinositol n-acetylglucosaminyltransferase protein [Botrytis fragariae]|uniref:Putative phosphatidylinositol n-acetylglucosaminyltransferase protein n=1 Tax=Botrytis fragariae TaxID=1964551 RepID=A0A8H6EHB0_9HELO|nr:putative phosphatidylinositol n-acetylglucosaminyltransferase protein [Botrytis fragariae]KAF5871875.1 putative phosphatidylinositol n-acetylglucosaminyltransferase protein [Botrytis fragariae]